MKKSVYLANPYSSKRDEPAASIERAERRVLESYVGGLLRKQYGNDYCFILPIALSAAMADLHTFSTGFSEWKSDDLTYVAMCTELWVLTTPGWKESIGVQAEINEAKRLDKIIKYVRYFNNTKTVVVSSDPLTDYGVY